MRKEKEHTASAPGLEPTPRFPAPLRYAVLGILLFLLIAAQGGGAERQSGVVMAALLAVSLVGPMPHWAARHRLSLPVLAVLAYFLLNCAAGMNPRFGLSGAMEFGKILAAFSVFALVVFRARRGEAKHLAATAAAVSAAFALLSIDASAAGFFSNPFFRLMDGVFGCDYRNLYTGFEAGSRITGVFSLPNVLAGFLALGIFLSLYLVRSSGTRRGRLGGCVLLGVNALGFLLAFSMGGIGTFLAAVLIYLLCEAKGRRLSLFLLLTETGIVTLLLGALSFGFLGRGGGPGMVPSLAALVGGVLLWALHEFVGLGLAQRLAQKGRTAAIAAGGLGAALALYLLLAFNLTGGQTLAPGESLRRSVYPAAGAYTLGGTWTGDAVVTVESQNDVNTIMHTSTVLYQGPLEGAAFTVPEDSKIVYLNFYAPGGAELEQVALSGGPGVKLGYKLLPSFAANRIQGLWANQNAIQRLAFFKDGLRMYAQSPLVGNGLGCVGGMLTGVQDFYYQSLYVHNQYIQVMAEMGLLGLAAFVLMLGAAALTLWRRRREGENDPLLPALAACLAMAALHGAWEADWSIGPFQIMALLTLGMIAVWYSKPLPRTDSRAVGVAFAAGVGGVCCVFAALLGAHLYADNAYAEVKAGQRAQTPYTMTELARLDKYNWAQYKLDMAVNAAESPKEEFSTLAAEYGAVCRALKVHSINLSLETYVYMPMGRYEEFFQASREGIPQAAALAETWQTEFALYETMMAHLPSEEQARIQWFADQVMETEQMLADYNAGRMEQITLTEANLAFLSRIHEMRG